MGIPILRVRDENGNVYAIPAIQGAAGAPGADGITPTIGANGNWFLGSTDTGKPSRGVKGEQGAQGPQGKPGPAGSDANVTAENIKSALGYTPANSNDVNQIKDDLESKLPKSPANWEPWTAEEQAAAQERLGILSVEGVLF